MADLKENVGVKMVRKDLENLPQFALPFGYSFRAYRDGDEEHWLRIQRAADRFNKITPAWFDQEFGPDRGPLAERQFYILNPRRTPVGTGTAWLSDDCPEHWPGKIHWLAILPEYQGRGLGKALLTLICNRLRELAHHGAYLLTSSARVIAIRLYSSFGFLPLIRNADEASAWKEFPLPLVLQSESLSSLLAPDPERYFPNSPKNVEAFS